VPAQVTALDPNSQLRRDYELAAEINTKAGWDAFLKTYPKGFYADLARAAQSKLSAPASQEIASLSAEQRNLSAANPPGHPQPGSAPGATIDNLVGKTYRVTFIERQDMLTPTEGKVFRPQRQSAVYVKSANELASHFIGLPQTPAGLNRFANAALGAVDRGMQVNYGDNQLLLIIQSSNYRIKTAITAIGNSCSAEVFFELQPGQQTYNFRTNAAGEQVTMKALVPENVVCWVSPGNAVGEPPVASAQPAPSPPAAAAVPPATAAPTKK
jgi:hypothetical protein